MRRLVTICATLLLCSFLAGAVFGLHQSRPGEDAPLVLILDGESGADYATYYQPLGADVDQTAELLTVNFNSLPVI